MKAIGDLFQIVLMGFIIGTALADNAQIVETLDAYTMAGGQIHIQYAADPEYNDFMVYRFKNDATTNPFLLIK